MSLGQTSNPKCGPTFPWIAFFFFPQSCLSVVQCPERGWERLARPRPAGFPIPQVDSGVSAGIWGPRMKGWSLGAGRGQGVGLEYIVSRDSL